MPAPAVIPAPIAYIKVVAVKKLVVGFRTGVSESLPRMLSAGWVERLIQSQFHQFYAEGGPLLLTGWGCPPLAVYFEKIRVFKAGFTCLNRLAWDNGIRLGCCVPLVE